MIKLEEHHIQFSSAKSFEEAIDICAGPLLKDNIITTDYVEGIKAMIDEECYFVLVDKIAFAHCRPELGSLVLGLGVLILNEEVKCANKDVKVILLMSGVNNENHLRLLQRISLSLKDGKDKDLLEAKTKLKILEIFS